VRRNVLVPLLATGTLLGATLIPITRSYAQHRPTPPPLISGPATEYVVLGAPGASLAATRAAIVAAGGTVIRENEAVGVSTAVSTNTQFVQAVALQEALSGAAHNRPIGQTASAGGTGDGGNVEHLSAQELAAIAAHPPHTVPVPATAEPLAGLQWDMQAIHATADGSQSLQPGDKRVLVGVIDTGIDGSHPDIAPNFNKELSRNFTVDIPAIDGPCADEPDQSCNDPVDVDEDGHGTHVAGTIAAAANGLGMAGIAPKVSLVNLRAGQDSGYFFLQSTIDALTYAGDIGVDVVNMSFFTDPWLFNCASNPADSPEQQLEQRTVIAATNRALDYAHAHGVTLIAALGNEHTDLGNPLSDEISPDYGADPHPRTIDNTCISMPSEGNHVLNVTALGPSGSKADYSNYGVERATVSAPGGFFRDFVGTPQYKSVGNLTLSAYPAARAKQEDTLNADGTPKVPNVVQDCQNGVCAYYQYLQGTSMAAPHAVGVAALIISQYGRKDRSHPGGLTMDPDKVERILRRTATQTPCPTPPLRSYAPEERTPDFDALCVGDATFNGFYGSGVVDALRAVQNRHDSRHDEHSSDT
jgi:lantibiotic leader peptide-processing serine protease